MASPRAKLKKLAKILNARFTGLTSQKPSIRNKDLIINIFSFNLSPVGKVIKLRNPWKDGKWFEDDS